MIEILDAKVNWMKGFMNYPEFQILVDTLPSWSDMRWVALQSTPDYICFHFEQDGLALAYSWSKHNQYGFDGDSLTFTLVSGEKITVKGPYAGMPSWPEICGPAGCSVVLARPEQTKLDKYNIGLAFHLTVPAAIKAAKIANVHLLKLQPSRTINGEQNHCIISASEYPLKPGESWWTDKILQNYKVAEVLYAPIATD